jgi:Protein of unknown function (DUF1153)
VTHRVDVGGRSIPQDHHSEAEDLLRAEAEDCGYRVVLPAPGNARWTASRKRAVLLALDLRVISEEQVCRRYAMHPEELSAWRRGSVYVLPAKRRRFNR